MYRTQLNHVKKLINDSRINFTNNLVADLDTMSRSKKDYLQIIRKLLGNKFTSNIPILSKPNSDTECITSLDKANLLLETLTEKYHTDTDYDLPNFPNRCIKSVNLPLTTPNDIKKLIQRLPVNKSCGPDRISNKML